MRFLALALAAGIGFSLPASAADLAGGAPYGTLNRSVLEPTLGLRGSIGLRYWYSRAQSNTTGGGVTLLDTDNVSGHSAEVTFKMQDESSGGFLRTYLGLGGNFGGDQSALGVNASSFDSSGFGYITLDGGWNFLEFAGGAVKTEAFIGYQYLDDQFDATYGGVSVSQEQEWHLVRLGLGATGDITDRVSWAAEAAAIPWAYNMTAGSDSTYAYGAQADLFVDYAVTPSFDVGVGGRYWYLHSDLSSTPGAEVEYQRYGLLLEAKYNF
ncbi:MAG: hypothetical protein ABJN26_01535 [Stappiaceae bacterium]